jgi:hypothetical protein
MTVETFNFSSWWRLRCIRSPSVRIRLREPVPPSCAVIRVPEHCPSFDLKLSIEYKDKRAHRPDQAICYTSGEMRPVKLVHRAVASSVSRGEEARSEQAE